jgi:hypothetical protein
MDNNNQEIIDIFLKHTPLYDDIMSIVIEFITPKTFKVGGVYEMFLLELDTIFFHQVLYRTKCYVKVDVFGLTYRKKIRYDKNDNEYIKLYTKTLHA